MQAQPPFRVIAADPPWRFSDSLPGKSRGASRNYRTLTVPEIESFLVDNAIPVADDALLFMWRVSAMVPEAYGVVRAWGFVPKSEIVWRKLTRTGSVHFGMGRYTRSAHETCIVASRGRNIVKDHAVRDVFDAVVGRHSEKPEAFFHLVERMADGPRLELFARTRRPGWSAIGDELAPVAAE
jgi:N6-adenosine-specific RNA methylase IME4